MSLKQVSADGVAGQHVGQEELFIACDCQDWVDLMYQDLLPRYSAATSGSLLSEQL